MKTDMTAEETKKIPEPAPAPSVSAPATPGTPDSGTPDSGSNASGSKKTGPKRRFPSFGDVLAMLGIALGAQILVSVLALPVLLVAGHGTDMASLPPAVLGRLQAVLYFVSMSVALIGVLYYRRLRGGRGAWVRCSLRGFNPALLLWAFVLIVAVGVVIEPLLRLLPAVHLDSLFTFVLGANYGESALYALVKAVLDRRGRERDQDAVLAGHLGIDALEGVGICIGIRSEGLGGCPFGDHLPVGYRLVAVIVESHPDSKGV